jgi:hypothetical protein
MIAEGSAIVALASLAPRTWRRRLAAGVVRHTGAVHVGYPLFVVTFVTFGACRAVSHVIG